MKQTKEQREAEKKARKAAHIRKYIRYGVIAFLFVTGLWSLGFVFSKARPTDYFPVFESLFSGLAFAGIIITVIMQRDELELQRDEMELTRDEFEKQNKTLSRQRFENTFFQLLQRQAEIRSSLELRNGMDFRGIGLTAFKNLYESINGEIDEIKKRNISNLADFTPEKLKGKIKAMPIEKGAVTTEFDKVYKIFENDLGHYYKHLFEIIKSVADTNVDLKKERYLGFVKSELSHYEMLCLFYFGLSNCGYRYKPLIEQTNLLRDIDIYSLIDKDHFGEYLFISKSN